MNYDETSFLVGLSVGQQLKGWATKKADSSGATSIGVVVGNFTQLIGQFSWITVLPTILTGEFLIQEPLFSASLIIPTILTGEFEGD